MPPPSRKTVDELVTRYQFEPTLRDIYVEGEFDADFFKWFFEHAGYDDVAVYDINGVDLPDYMVEELGQKLGNKGRVLSLALKLSELMNQACPQLTCVADIDLENLFGGPQVNLEHLRYTERSCLDMYFFEIYILEKFVALFARRAPDSANKFSKILNDILHKAGLVRAANDELGWMISWTNISGYCKIFKGQLSFNSDKHILDFLRAGGKGASVNEFKDKIGEIRLRAPDDCKMFANGHDFVELLTWYARKYGRIGNLQASTVLNTIASSVDYEFLRVDNFFDSLCQRLSA